MEIEFLAISAFFSFYMPVDRPLWPFLRQFLAGFECGLCKAGGISDILWAGGVLPKRLVRADRYG